MDINKFNQLNQKIIKIKQKLFVKKRVYFN